MKTIIASIASLFVSGIVAVIVMAGQVKVLETKQLYIENKADRNLETLIRLRPLLIRVENEIQWLKKTRMNCYEKKN